MRVWIDQDLCTGDGLCEEICPQVFQLSAEGLAHVHDAGGVRNDPGGSAGTVEVREPLLEAVLDAAEECPGECIFVEA
ncbi:MAG: ferredoxin [Actinomycetota bacterium]|nr:ferredoxin [Actinomycetota bacterium]